MVQSRTKALILPLLLGAAAVVHACTVEVLLPGEGVDRAALPDTAQQDEPPAGPAAEAPPSFHIEHVEPGEGDSTGGGRVRIVGELFEPGAIARFGEDDAADVLWLAGDLLDVEVPPGAPGLVDVTVLNPDGASTTLKGGFRYLASTRIASVDPPSGPGVGGTPITVTGEGFLPGSKLLVGGRLAIKVERVDDGTLVALTPGGPPGPADVYVVHSAGAARARDAFVYSAPVRIDTVSPPNGPSSGGGVVNLLGEGLGDVATVTIGGTDAQIIATWGDGTVTVLAPPGPPGAADVLATTPWATGLLPGGYAWIDAAAPDDVLALLTAVPQKGPAAGGTLVTLSGTGIPTGALSVRFGAKDAEVVTADPASHTIVVRTPPAAPGTVDLLVTGPTGSSTLPGAFTFLPALSVAAVSPESGPAGGGTQVTLTGSGFEAGMQVRVGPLGCSQVQVLGPSEATAITASGSPGPSDVGVTLGDAVATLPKAFDFTVPGTDVLVSKPVSGAAAGGTFMRIYGTGFGADATVRVGPYPASGVVVHDSTLITGWTPPGTIGTWDVVVTTNGYEEVLPGAFTYYDPTSGYGGTWGEAVDEAVNVTVLDLLSGEPIPGAFVVLRATADVPYTGVTDENGEITFGGPGLLGRQVATASKAAYSTASVVEFDATNVTLQLFPYIPPTPGGEPGTPLEPGSVSGRVTGLGKYLVIPPGSCAGKDTTVSLYCLPCVDAADCGNPDAVCAQVGDEGTFCTTRCDAGEACPDGYACASNADGTARCLPAAGHKEARCIISEPDSASGVPDIEAGVVVAGDGTFATPSRLGEVAVVCRGGYVDADSGAFVPLMMGLARHVFVTPGLELPDQDIELSIPLERRVDARLDDPPSAPEGPNSIQVEAWLTLGTDGAIPMGAVTGSTPGGAYTIRYLPLVLTGELYDATYTFWAGAYTNLSGQTPYSVVVERGVTQLGGEAVLQRSEGAWAPVATSAEDDLRAVWGTDDGIVWAVGDRGGILRSDGGGWSRQPSPTRKDLLAVDGLGPGQTWAVGRSGAAVGWDGLKWTQEKTGTTKDLRGVVVTSQAAWAAGWYTVLRRDAAGWSKVEGAPAKDLYAIAVAAGELWAVGAHGAALRFDGSGWTEETTPADVTLRGLWGSSDGVLVAVGDGGTVLRRGAGGWAVMAGVPTKRPLRAVHGRFVAGQLELWVVGADGLVLRHDGTEWFDESPAGTTTDLAGVWAPPLGEPVAVGTRDLLLGPFMRVPQLGAAPGSLAGASFELVVDPGVEPHFRYISLDSAYGLPLWILVVKGDATTVELPDLKALAGLDPLPTGPKTMRIYSVYKDDFDIDSYDAFDFSILGWHAWSVAEHPFE